MTLEQLKAMYLKARLDKNALQKSILGCLIADVELGISRGKEVDIVALIRKYITNAQSNFSYKADPIYEKEIELLQNILPKQLTENQIKAIILDNLIIDGKIRSMKSLIHIFKTHYTGQYDPALVAKNCKMMIALNQDS